MGSSWISTLLDSCEIHSTKFSWPDLFSEEEEPARLPTIVEVPSGALTEAQPAFEWSEIMFGDNYFDTDWFSLPDEGFFSFSAFSVSSSI